MTIYNSRLDKSPFAWSGAARDKVVPHPMIRPGTKFLFDSREPACHPTGVIVPGSVLDGTVFNTLKWPDAAGAFAGPSAVIKQGAGNPWQVNDDGSLKSPAYLFSQTRIQVGTAGQFDMAPAEYEYLAIIWFQPPSAGYSTTAYGTLASLAVTNANDAQVWFDWGTTGLRPRCAIGLGSGNSLAAGYSADRAMTGAPVQLAAHFKPGGTLAFYCNGVLVQSVTTTVTDLQSAAAAIFAVGGALVGDILAFSLTDIAASVTAETAFGTRDAADIWSAAQHIAADYAYGMGTRTQAPSNAYA